MTKYYLIGKLTIFICLLSACSSPEQSQNLDQSNPYIKLSTEENQSLQESNESINEEPIANEMKQDSKNGEIEGNGQIQQEQDTQQQTIPENPITEDRLQKQEVQKNEDQSNQATTVSTKLPFQDFKARWNAVSDEQMSNLYIRNLEKISSTEYRALLTNQLELNIVVANDFIQQLVLISNDPSKVTINSMLAGWSQIINLLHPDIEIYDVDELFNKIGVGPNSDVSNVKQTSFTYYELHYEVIPTEKGYTFKAGYDKSQ
jgi:hypothetical protein